MTYRRTHSLLNAPMLRTASSRLTSLPLSAQRPSTTGATPQSHSPAAMPSVCINPTEEQLSLLSLLKPRFEAHVRAVRRRTIGFCKRDVQIRGDFLLILRCSCHLSMPHNSHTGYNDISLQPHPFQITKSKHHLSATALGNPHALNPDDVHVVIPLPNTNSIPPSTAFLNPQTAYTFRTGAEHKAKNNRRMSSTFAGNAAALKNNPCAPNVNPYTKLIFSSTHSYAEFVACLPTAPLKDSSALAVSDRSQTVDTLTKHLRSLPDCDHEHDRHDPRPLVPDQCILPLLSRGKASSVYAYTEDDDTACHPCAVKVLRKADVFNSDALLKRVMSERLALHVLRDAKYVSTLRHAVQTPTHFALVSDLAR